MRLRQILLVAAAACFLSAPIASASVIGWNPAVNTTAATDISTNGTLVDAFNGGAGSPTVNGVTFTASNPLGMPPFTGALNGGTTGDAGLTALLNTFSFGGGTSTTIDLGTFTAGNTYEVQVFYTDQRTASNDRVMTFGSQDSLISGAPVNLEADPNNAISSPFGQFAIGTFVADGDDPDLTLATNNFGNAHITAWQIRDLGAVPEASAAMVWSMLTLVGFCYRRRNAGA